MSSIQKQLGLQCYVLYTRTVGFTVRPTLHKNRRVYSVIFLYTKTVGFRVNDLFLPVLVVGRGVEGLLLYGQSVLILVLQ